MARALAVGLAVALASCATEKVVMDLRFGQTVDGAAQERAKYKEPVSAVVVRGARLRHAKPAEVLSAADPGTGGTPQLLMQAGRSVVPGSGVVVLATARTEESGGSVAGLVVVMLALECEDAALDKPGELRGCKGYAMRVPRQWPGEVYGLSSAVVSVMPEGGTVRGRMRGRSDDGAFTAEFDGELVGSVLELQAATPAAGP